MAMFPQFFTHASLYPNFFRPNAAATVPNLSLSSQLALLSNSTFPPNGFNSSALLATSPNSQFFVDNLLRDRAAAAAAAQLSAAVAAASSAEVRDPLVVATGQSNSFHSTSEPNHSPCEYGNCTSKHCSGELCRQSGRSSANASDITDHETESSQCCDRNSDSSSPSAPPPPPKTSQLKFGVSAILSDSKECKSSKGALKGMSRVVLSFDVLIYLRLLISRQ